RYCSAKAICPSMLSAVAVLSQADQKKVDSSPKEDMAPLLDFCALAEQAIEAIRTKARAMLFNEPHAIPGWRLTDGAVRRNINNVEKAADALAIAGIFTKEETEKAMNKSLSLNALENALRRKIGISAKEAKEMIEQQLKHLGLIDFKRSAAALEREK